MSDVGDYLVTADKDPVEALKIVHRSATRLEQRQLSLIDIVQSLGEYINDDDVMVRSRAIGFLTHFIDALPASLLSRQQIQVLNRFFCDRIEDDGAITALENLSKLPRFTPDTTVMSFRALIEHFSDIQSRTQTQRFKVLSFLNSLMQKRRQSIKDLGSESLAGILGVISGEKDPRNLMVVFSVVRVVIFEWDVRAYAEALFEAVFCYFPITFRPPPNDPYGITAQDLKAQLRDCIAASPYLAPFAIPQLLEKLDSSSLNTKRDVLDAIAACAHNYDIVTMSQHATTLWDGLKYEIFNAQDESLVSEVLTTITAVVGSLSASDDRVASSYLEQWLQPVIKECNERLQEPQHKQAKPAREVLRACAEASFPSLEIILKGVFPPLLTLYQDSASTDERRAILKHISYILLAILHCVRTHSDVNVSGLLSPLKEQLFETFCQALMSAPADEVSLRLLAIECLSTSCVIPHFLSSAEVGMVVQHLDEIVLDEFDGRHRVLTEAVIECLVQISRTQPLLIMDITFPTFMARLPEHSPGNTTFFQVLETLAKISIEKSISNTLIQRLFNRFDVVARSNGSMEYARALLSTLIHALSRKNLSTDSDMEQIHQRVFELVLRCAEKATKVDDASLICQISIIEMIGKLARLVVRASDPHKQRTASEQAYLLFCDNAGDVEVWTAQMAEKRRSTVLLSTYLIAAINPDISLPFTAGQQPVLIKRLTRLAVDENHPTIRHSVLQHLSLVVNKFASAETLDFVTGLLLEPTSGLFDLSNLTQAGLRAGIWISKALILRLASVQPILLRLLEILRHSEVGIDAAYAFPIILAQDEIVSKENGATIRLLATQRVFYSLLPTESRNSEHAADATAKTNCLIALSGILKYVDKDTVKLESGRLIPLLLQSLDLEHQIVKAAAIQTLTILTTESPTILQSHISSLIHRLLSAAKDTAENSPAVRSNSLRCLYRFAVNIEGSKLLPYRRLVCRGLIRILDDSKRDVRKEAVACRTAWLNLDEPDEAD